MKQSAGRAALSVIAFVAVATTILSFGPADRATSGGFGCPLNCSGNGVCVNGSFCQCDACFGGLDCATECSDNGTCFNGSCGCDPCFSGPLCQTECSDNGFCGNGSCICDVGYSGGLCEIPPSTTSTLATTTTVSTSTSSTTSTTIGTAFIGVTAKKLVVVDKLATAAKAKAVFVSKDTVAGITKGPGLDRELISVDFDVRYADGSATGHFGVPAGATNGTTGWVVNRAQVAKFVNKDAPGGSTETKVAVIKPNKLLKLVGKGLGDVPFDIFGAGPPAGSVFTAYCVANDGVENCHCTEFPACNHTLIAAGQGAKLVCRDGIADPVCTALEPPPPVCPTNGDPPAFCSYTGSFCDPQSGQAGTCRLCLNGGTNGTSTAEAACLTARCGLNCSDPMENGDCGAAIIVAGCEEDCCSSF